MSELVDVLIRELARASDDAVAELADAVRLELDRRGLAAGLGARGRLRPGALLTRTDLASLGLGRRAIDAVFRALPVVVLPDYSRPMVRAEDYLVLIESSTYRDDRVRSNT